MLLLVIVARVVVCFFKETVKLFFRAAVRFYTVFCFRGYIVVVLVCIFLLANLLTGVFAISVYS